MATKARPSRSASASKKSPAKVSARAAKPVRSAAGRKTAGAVAKASKTRGNGRSAKPTNGRKPTRPAVPRSAGRTAVVGGAAVVLPPVPVIPAGPTIHDLAMEVFEKGVRALQNREFREAAAILGSVIETYPDEKELHDRARVYMAICERQCAPKRDQAPRTLEERMNAATVALNRGAFTEALEFLRSVKTEDAENDAVYYMLAVAHAGLGDAESAVTHLHEAIELNPDNRFLAAQDSDLDALREQPAFAALLDSPPAPRRRPAVRPRPSR
jgi:hypothetical protein